MAVKKLLVSFFILALATLACGINVDLGTSPSSSSTPTNQSTNLDQVSTLVAQTLQALTQTALAATPADTPTAMVTPTPINTPIPPTLSVSVATNCYAGPSTNYGFVITIHPGTIVTVSGKDTADKYWIIDAPGYPGTICWLSGQYASVSGDTTDLPAPATPEASIYTLSEPTNVRVSCNKSSSGPGTVNIRWRNTDPDQTQVRVYRGGYRIATLGGGVTSYTDDWDWDGWGWGWHNWDLTYGVQAANSSEVSSIVTGSC